ncbi:MAG: hypothetical protein QM530_05125 [Phycisphaerales bacterium]|nr:hypothetical protein [Phycisphaerales bacterium]
MPKPLSPKQQQPISLPYRKLENLHIIFWLFKDMSWCMQWRPLGIAMILPTLIAAIIITVRSRDIFSEWIHNLAIIAWIVANSYWMISEFFHFDNQILYGTWAYKHLAIFPFCIGLLFLAYYYGYWKPKHKEAETTL